MCCRRRTGTPGSGGIQAQTRGGDSLFLLVGTGSVIDAQSHIVKVDSTFARQAVHTVTGIVGVDSTLAVSHDQTRLFWYNNSIGPGGSSAFIATYDPASLAGLGTLTVASANINGVQLTGIAPCVGNCNAVVTPAAPGALAARVVNYTAQVSWFPSLLGAAADGYRARGT